ncbi:MAG TPA: winged helix-turn-helix domain-containing protein, partial [Rubrivivax sp.]|nr:winged helix-turn-helix domain-containing protein [Rubrivivax sp.]
MATHAGLTRPGLRLEPATRSLHGPAGTVVLEPRVMQVLLALADADGGVVSREALLLAGWGGSIVGDDAIHRAVSGARRVLRQAGTQTCTVETIPRVGYRLVIADAALDAGADVSTDANAGTDAGVDGLAPAAADSAPPAEPVPPRSITAHEACKGTGASAAGDVSRPVPQRQDKPGRRRLLGGVTAAAVLGLGGWQ